MESSVLSRSNRRCNRLPTNARNESIICQLIPAIQRWRLRAFSKLYQLYLTLSWFPAILMVYSFWFEIFAPSACTTRLSNRQMRLWTMLRAPKGSTSFSNIDSVSSIRASPLPWSWPAIPAGEHALGNCSSCFCRLLFAIICSSMMSLSSRNFPSSSLATSCSISDTIINLFNGLNPWSSNFT